MCETFDSIKLDITPPVPLGTGPSQNIGCILGIRFSLYVLHYTIYLSL